MNEKRLFKMGADAYMSGKTQRPRQCVCCKNDFNTSLKRGQRRYCPSCRQMSKEERRSLNQKVSHVILMAKRAAINMNQAISNPADLEGEDRGVKDGFTRYWTQRPIHFKMLYGVTCTPENLKLCFKKWR